MRKMARTKKTHSPLVRSVERRWALERGVTLFEVIIVVAILALIAGGVGAAVFPAWTKARVDSTKTSAHAVRQAALQWRALNTADDCPTVSRLVEDKQLDAARGKEDAWGQPFTVICTVDDVTVSSLGPDKKDNTEDDIVVGPKATGEAE